MRYICIITLLMFAHFVHAQETPMNPTSATDRTVRIHGGKKSTARTSIKAEKSAEVHVYKNQTKPLRNKKKVKKLSGEGRVFKRHNHFANKEIQSRARQKKKAPLE